jgi:uncharacterized protein YqeY
MGKVMGLVKAKAAAAARDMASVSELIKARLASMQ